MRDAHPSQSGFFDVGALNNIIAALPESEQKGAVILFGNIVFLHKYVDAFGSAVALIDYVELLQSQVALMNPDDLARARNTHTLLNWIEMSGREAAMTVYHFGKCARAINSGLKDQNVTRQTVESSTIKLAIKRFDVKFPNVNDLRNAVAHRAENTASYERISEHASKGELYYGGMSSKREYRISSNQKHCTLMIDEQVRSFLADIANEITRAFPSVASVLPLSKV